MPTFGRPHSAQSRALGRRLADNGEAYPRTMTDPLHASRLSRLLAPLVDVAPAWMWRPANFRQLGPLDIHFCYGHDGHRTVEINGREIIAGNRVRNPDVE
jgi:hypothetical protein